MPVRALDHRPDHTTCRELIAVIRDVHETLRSESDLSPANERVTAAVSRLMDRLRAHYPPDVVQAVVEDANVHELQHNLRPCLSRAEFLAEAHVSTRLTASSVRGFASITDLPSWPVYEALVNGELQLLKQLIRTNTLRTPVVFVGSGPLPLSPIALHQFGEADVVCLERDDQAYASSTALLSRLGLADHVTVMKTDGADFDYRPYPFVMIASLVTPKQEVLAQIRRTRPDALVAVRTAEGLRRLMYEAVDEAALHAQGWRQLARTSPVENLVINSTLFLAHAEAGSVRYADTSNC